MQTIEARDGKTEDVDRYVLGRIAECYGLNEIATRHYSQIEPHEDANSGSSDLCVRGLQKGGHAGLIRLCDQAPSSQEYQHVHERIVPRVWDPRLRLCADDPGGRGHNVRHPAAACALDLSLLRHT
jgi:hypothetical protein